MTETWKPVGEFAPGYSASSLGRVRNDKTGTILSPCSTRGGYLAVSVVSKNHNGRRGIVSVHRLVGIAFHGMPQPGQVTRHSNDVRTDNRPENLCWGTYQENSQDSIDRGTVAYGARTNHATLTDEQVVALREERAAGASIQSLGTKYGIAWSVVSAICAGKWWTRVGGPRTVGFRSRRSVVHRGERVGGHKMTEDSVRALRRDRVSGASYRALGEKYGINESAAWGVVNGKTWTHVPAEVTRGC